MIFVDRNRIPPPEFLYSKLAEKARASIKALYEKSETHLAQLRMGFTSSIWLRARPALNELFFDKCAYCESPTRGGFFHDIDHFRPKQFSGGIRKIDEHLYYGWLVYEWENLYNACPVCNRRRNGKDGIVGKGNFFPVDGPRAPLLSSISECRAIETGTLIDPCYDDPSEHITFETNGKCQPKTDRGLLTITLLDLNREALIRERQTISTSVHEVLLAISKQKLGTSEKLKAKNEKRLIELIAPQAPFAGCARSCVEQYKKQLNLEHLQALYLPSSAKITYTKKPITIAPENWSYSTQYTSKNLDDLLGGAKQYPNKKKLPTHASKRLTRIEIKNFKTLEHIDIHIPDTASEYEDRASALMLLGENGTGKSSILEAVALALLGRAQIERAGLKGKSFLRRDEAWKLTGEPAEIRLSFGETEDQVNLTIDPVDGSFQGDFNQQVVILGYGPRRYFNDKIKSKRSDEAYARVRTMFDPRAILGDPSKWLSACSKVDFDASVRALRQVMFLSDEAYVSRSVSSSGRQSKLDLILNQSRTPLRNLSEGYRTVVATAVDIMQELLAYWPDLESAQGIVLIDELDTHLHPRWKMRIMSRLRTAMPGVQFIATTHDPLCLRGLYNGEVQVLRRAKNSVVEQVFDLPNVQGLSVEQLLMSDFFGLLSTEDPDTDQELIRYFALADKVDPTKEEMDELLLHRQSLEEKIHLGPSPETILMYQIASENLQKQSEQQSSEFEINTEYKTNDLLDLWLSLVNEVPHK